MFANFSFYFSSLILRDVNLLYLRKYHSQEIHIVRNTVKKKKKEKEIKLEIKKIPLLFNFSDKVRKVSFKMINENSSIQLL